MCVFFFRQKTAYEMRISDWSSDVGSSDLPLERALLLARLLLDASSRCRVGGHVHREAVNMPRAAVLVAHDVAAQLHRTRRAGRAARAIGDAEVRSAERRVGKAWVSTCRTTRQPYNSKQKIKRQ